MSVQGDRDVLHAAMVQRYHEYKFHEHQRILARHKIIEERKEHLEQMNIVRVSINVLNCEN